MVSRDLLQQLKTYAEKVRPASASKYLFTTHQGKGKGGRITESVSPALSKIYLLLTMELLFMSLVVIIFLSQTHEMSVILYLSLQTMSKLVDREWKRHGKDSELPKLTATKARKVAVSSLREQGATRQDQEALARQMAHNVTTADKYYDKGLQTEQRKNVLGKLRSHYKVTVLPLNQINQKQISVQQHKYFKENRQTLKLCLLTFSDSCST